MPGRNSREREAIKGAYLDLDGKPSKKWTSKVDQMDDGQVIAVYMRLKKQGKVN
jgi:hypothetical protein